MFLKLDSKIRSDIFGLDARHASLVIMLWQVGSGGGGGGRGGNEAGLGVCIMYIGKKCRRKRGPKTKGTRT